MALALLETRVIFILHRPRGERVLRSHWWILGKDHSGGDKLTRSVEWSPFANSKCCSCCFYKLMCYMLVLPCHVNAEGNYPNLGIAAGKELPVGQIPLPLQRR